MSFPRFWLAVSLLVTACGADKSSNTGPVLAPGPGAFDPTFATSDAFFTRMSKPAKGLSSSPHNIVQIFYSNDLEPAVGLDHFDAPVGSVAIKTQDQNGDGKIDNIMAMVKQAPGSLPDNGDWLFERYFADGTLDVSGGPTLGFCWSCHSSWPDTSNLAGTSLSN